ncbi:phosphatidylcholine:ceramide cholinephosphotransferase 2-like isoform X2 [Macrosteles quadrilineatus]|uniref:phosphatidylcholine:ceramide cholinephosphotransferase 2-like isoform X2 n=1 Tax=Macrosteles quadrilineatus TaxID=74068 RepID=UPI0023E25A1B|nr:phosphatidylcholine:ceramide cholinephosphotransferase 2-like isoform X2 [Macrosteles quadrilineatus]
MSYVSIDPNTHDVIIEVYSEPKRESDTDSPVPMMVLDPKSGGSHNDYGSFSGEGEGEGEGSAPVTAAAAAAAGVVTGGGGGPVMAQSDLYQRQPLLTSDTPCQDDEDDKMDGLKRNTINSNGVVRIDVVPPLQREEPRYPKEKMKTFIAILVLLFHMVLSTLSLALIHDRVPDRSYPPLPDTFLDNMPTADWALDVSEILIMISINVSTGVILMHKHRFIVFRRVCLMLSLLYLMRSITMYVTVLPMSSKTYVCSPKENHTSAMTVAKRVFQLISGFGLSINGKHTYCGDYIYSGHTIMLTMSYLIISEYSPKRLWPLHWASFVASFVGVIFVLVARGHYTVDVIIAYWVTTRIFWIYHTLANHASLKNRSPNNLLSRAWWFRIFQYFEGNVGGPLPRVHDWPLPWPRRFLAKHPNRDS